MKILLLTHLVFICFELIRSKGDIFLSNISQDIPSNKQKEFMDSKEMLMLEIIKDLKEDAQISCLHYVIDSDSHVFTPLTQRPKRSKRPSREDSAPSIPIKIVDYRKMRFKYNFLSL